jgi:hypothetical protein
MIEKGSPHVKRCPCTRLASQAGPQDLITANLLTCRVSSIISDVGEHSEESITEAVVSPMAPMYTLWNVRRAAAAQASTGHAPSLSSMRRSPPRGARAGAVVAKRAVAVHTLHCAGPRPCAPSLRIRGESPPAIHLLPVGLPLSYDVLITGGYCWSFCFHAPSLLSLCRIFNTPGPARTV